MGLISWYYLPQNTILRLLILHVSMNFPGCHTSDIVFLLYLPLSSGVNFLLLKYFLPGAGHYQLPAPVACHLGSHLCKYLRFEHAVAVCFDGTD